MEFFKEAPSEDRKELRTTWFEMTRCVGDNVDADRD
jgi:hypothetical protein